jgi:hypothetical protein
MGTTGVIIVILDSALSVSGTKNLSLEMDGASRPKQGSGSVSFCVMPAKLVLAEAGSGHPVLDQGQTTDFSASDGKLALLRDAA